MKNRILLTLILFSAALTGCAVKPEKTDAEKAQSFTNEKQKPVTISSGKGGETTRDSGLTNEEAIADALKKSGEEAAEEETEDTNAEAEAPTSVSHTTIDSGDGDLDLQRLLAMAAVFEQIELSKSAMAMANKLMGEEAGEIEVSHNDSEDDADCSDEAGGSAVGTASNSGEILDLIRGEIARRTAPVELESEQAEDTDEAGETETADQSGQTPAETEEAGSTESDGSLASGHASTGSTARTPEQIEEWRKMGHPGGNIPYVEPM